MDTLFNRYDYLSDFKLLKEYLHVFSVTIPTLYKQYSELLEKGGVQFMVFGIDSAFNDCIDGYIFVDLQKFKPKKDKGILPMPFEL